MKSEDKKLINWTLAILVISIVFAYIMTYHPPKKYVMEPESERTKIFNHGDMDDVRAYLQSPGATINIDNYFTLTRRNRFDIMEMMFRDFKLNPDYNFKYEYATPLLNAAEEYKPDVVRVLIKYGADVNFKDPYGVTPLIATAYTIFEREYPARFEITKMLVDAGADINIDSNFGRNAIAGALGPNEDMIRAKFLLDNGGDINWLDSDGLNFMFYCSAVECYDYFIDKGIDINSVANDGKSILQSSLAGNSDFEVTKYLLDSGANICHKDNAGDTILNYVEHQDIFPHTKKENPEFYKEVTTRNRNSEMYKFLESEYNKHCIQ